MDEIERMIRVILSRHDLSASEGRDAAYSECLEYAENELSHDLRCNSFLRRVAEMLEKEPVEYEVIREMVDMPSDALLDVSYDEKHGFVITGNYAGLGYMAEVFKLLSEAPSGEHVHFYNDEEPLTPVSFNAIFYVEEDAWFRKVVEEESKADEDDGPPRRPISPEDIFALQIVGDMPHDLTLSRDRLYKVDKWTGSFDEAIWKKSFSANDERYILFTISDDRGEDLEIVLHLDDPDVNYFRKSDFAGLMD